MPAGPAPTTATRSRGRGDGGPGSSSADTSRILSRPGGRAPGSENPSPGGSPGRACERWGTGVLLATAVVVVQAADDVLGQDHVPAVDERVAPARGAGAGGGGRPGQPAVEVVQRAVLRHH